MARDSLYEQRQNRGEEAAVRARILDAAFEAFVENGYAATSTLEIATRARVSKRDLYALVGNKREVLTACILERATRLQVPADLPVPHDRSTLAQVLTSFGMQLVREISDPTVVAALRLAIADAVHAPEAARALDSIGREAVRAALRKIMAQACASGLLDDDPARLAEQFGGLLWGDLLVGLLLGVAKQPNARQIAERARNAANAFLQLHPRSPQSYVKPRGSSS
jgi:AcrR family transcriptional regulator